MSVWFHLRATSAIIRYRPGAVIRMLLVALAGSLWLLAGGWWSLATWRSLQQEAAEVRMELFLLPGTPDSVSSSILRGVRAHPAVAAAQLVHEQQVWDEFRMRVGVSEDLRDVVQMPRIVRARLRSEHVSTKQLILLSSALALNHRANCSEVVWPRELVRSLDARRADVAMLGTVAAALSVAVFGIGLWYAFRSELNHAAADIRSAATLGASAWWSAAPHILLGVSTGLLGLGLAVGLLLLGRANAIDRLQWLSSVESADMGLMALAIAAMGLMLALWQPLMAARDAGRVRKPS
jgi:cell division protein FtsX